MNRKTEPQYVKEWRKLGFDYVDIEDGYVRVSDTEYDIVGATIIYFDERLFSMIARAYHK